MAGFIALNILLIAAELYGSVPMLPMILWTGLALLVMAHRIYLASFAYRRHHRDDMDALALSFSRNSVQLGLITCVVLATAMPSLSSPQQLLLAVSGAVQIGGVAFTSRTLPRAAYPHVVFIALGLVLGAAQISGVSRVGFALLIIAATILQIGMIMIAHKSFVDRILHERDLNESVSTVKMLLNDFEAQGSDWLFELDSDGRMVKVSPRFAEAAGAKAEDMNGRVFAALFNESPARRQLQDHIADRLVLRNHLLEVDTGQRDSNRWWSVSLRPMISGVSNRFRGVVSDVSAAKHAEARVRHMAHYDSLTGLPNRILFNSAIENVLKTRPEDMRLAILLIDFDHFKSINDMYGHPIGDAFLRHVGTKLAATIASSQLGGEGSIVARLGGDEFAVLLAGEDAVDHALRLAQRLVDTFAEPSIVDDLELASGVSIGISIAPDHGEVAASLLSKADTALYVAKDEGRGRWELFEPNMDVALQKRHGIARDLRTAVANGELRLFLQPLVDVDTRSNVGFEALMRWEHPVRGLVMPDDFIPIAEETGLIVPMGEWMIRTALSEAAGWDEPAAIAINLSPIQLRSPNLLPTIVSALAKTGIDPGRVELEITETVLLHDSEANIEVLNRLHALGLKIALDDFGTGYASLNYLLTFPFDKIKIDRSFVNDLENREDAQAIVTAVISLANQLGMCTLAEGVEEEAQLTRLRTDGCEMVQGWLFGKAMPAEHYSEALRGLPNVRSAA